MEVTLEDMIRSVGRELGMRKGCYPRWVEQRRKIGGIVLTQERADHELACMDALYKMLVEKRTAAGEADG